MNILMIISDTLRRDYLGCYGNDWVKTPGIDALAEESLVCDKVYVGSFPTIPMRHDLMTGKYCFQTTGWAPIQAGIVPVQSFLQRDGYVTCLVADHVQMMAPGYNYHQGFSSVNWIRGQATDPWITDPITWEAPCALEKLRQSENWLERYMRNISRRRTEADWFSPQTMQTAMDWLEGNHTHEKWCLWVDTFDVHEPWTPPQWYVDMYDPGYEGEEVIYPRYDRADYLTQAEIKHCRALYAGTITMMDRWIGRLLQKVKDLGLWDDTAVFFISDHGWYHGEHGYMGKHTVLDRNLGWPFYEEVAHIPFLMRVPGVAEGGRSDVLMQPVDVMPTILDAAGVEAPEGLHGAAYPTDPRNDRLNDRLDGRRNDRINGRGTATAAYPPTPFRDGRGGTATAAYPPTPFRDGRGRTTNGGARELAITAPKLPADPEVRAYTTISDGQWTLIHAGANAEAELYDVGADPKQETDVIGEHGEIAAQLHAKHLAMLEEIGTPEDVVELRRAL